MVLKWFLTGRRLTCAAGNRLHDESFYLRLAKISDSGIRVRYSS